MLVLSRFESESIIIGDDIVITIVSIGRGRVRVGIEAHESVKVLRDELKESKRKEGKE
jgi:carbon storage regulator